MDFDTAFDRLIGHEGGYSTTPRTAVERPSTELAETATPART